MEFIHNYKKDLDMVRDVEIVEFTKGVLSVRRTLKMKIRRLEH